MTVKEIADLVGGKVEGDGSVSIKGACGIKEAQDGDVTFLANSRYQPLLKDTNATAVIIPPDIAAPKGKIVIRHESPSLAFARIMEKMGPPTITYKPGIHSTAIVGNKVIFGKDVSIQPYVVIEDDVIIGDNTVLGAGVFVGRNTRIGHDTFIHPKVIIRERVEIGNRCILHSGAVIGSDGFGYATVQGIHHKIPQIGTVVIEDDVEIGANVTIDRARIDKTLIKKGTKIDNLVQIAHNVIIGENSIIVAQTGISGSTIVGKNVTLAGQTGVVGHITIGDNSIVLGRAGVTKSVPAGQMVSGYPAAPHSSAMRLQALVNKLPKLFEKIVEIEKKLGIKK
jgi:UDP-3-O-[3-hydroxymyristoyl] glucosamine N-acyltransferase